MVCQLVRQRTPIAKRALLVGSAIATSLAATFSAAIPAKAQSTEDNIPEVESSIPDTETPEAEASSRAESTTSSNPLSEDARFECQISNGEYTVMYLPKSQPDRAFAWATPKEMGGGWTAESRCYTISDRLEAYRPEGLSELQVGTENGYNTVCAITEQEPNLCKIVFTVPPGQNPVVTRDLVFQNLTLADSGNDTTVVSTFAGTSSSNNILGQITEALSQPFPSRAASSNDGINLKPFLDPSDGGTGAALNNSPSSRQLDPDNFR